MISSVLYYAYFEHQAVSHPVLLHGDENKVFALSTVAEATGDLGDVDVATGGFIFRLFEPWFGVGKGGDNLPEQQYQGGFMVARRHDQANLGSEDYLAALQESEAILVDFIEKMYSDSQAGHALYLGEGSETLRFNVRPRPVTGDGSFAGYICTFQLSHPTAFCSPPSRVGWLDGGVTPSA